MNKEKYMFWPNYLWLFKASAYFYIFILFVFTQSVFASETKSIKKTAPKQNISYCINSSFFNSNEKSGQKSTIPNSDEEKPSDENEFSEDNDGISGFSNSATVCYTFKISVGINHYLYQLKQILYNRCAIALFVLHHSWKSFLN